MRHIPALVSGFAITFAGDCNTIASIGGGALGARHDRRIGRIGPPFVT